MNQKDKETLEQEWLSLLDQYMRKENDLIWIDKRMEEIEKELDEFEPMPEEYDEEEDEF